MSGSTSELKYGVSESGSTEQVSSIELEKPSQSAPGQAVSPPSTSADPDSAKSRTSRHSLPRSDGGSVSRLRNRFYSGSYDNPYLQSIDKFFGVRQRGGSLEAELLGGITMWCCSIYILTVSPVFQAGCATGAAALTGDLPLLLNELGTSTAVISCLATLSVGIICNTPLIVAPGMGFNGFFSLIMVASAGESWQAAMGLVFLTKLVYLIIASTVYWFDVGGSFFFAIPPSFRTGIGVGIGLFLGFLGLFGNTGVGFVEATAAGLSFPREMRYQFFLAIGGIILLVLLLQRRWRSTYVVVLMVVTILSIIIRAAKGEQLIPPDSFGHYSIGGVFGQLSFDFDGDGGKLFVICIILILHKFMDVISTLLSVAQAVVTLSHHGSKAYDGAAFQKVVRSSKKLHLVFVVDAFWSCMSPIFGVSPTTIFIESITGIAVGAKTGLSSVVAGLLFFLSIFLLPIIRLVPPEATGIIMFVVAVNLFKLLNHLDFKNTANVLPGIMCLVLIPLTNDISLGVSLALCVAPFVWAYDPQFKELLFRPDGSGGINWASVSVLGAFYVGAWLNILAAMDAFYSSRISSPVFC